MTDRPLQVARKVYFFRIAHFGELVPKLEGAIEHIAKLPFNDQGRYLPTSTDDTVHSVFVDSEAFPIRLQLARIRRSDLPLIEEAGQISALELSQKAGIMDWCHVIIYSDGYAVAEFNRDAPRIAALGEYLLFKSAGRITGVVRFLPLFQKSILKELEEFKAISILEIEALTTEADAIAKGDRHIGAAFAACSEIGQVRKTEIVLKTAYQPNLDLKEVAKRLLSNPFSRESLTKLRAHGRKGDGRKELDLLQQYKIQTEDFVRLNPRSKAVDSAHAFSVLERVYGDARSTLDDAVSIDGDV